MTESAPPIPATYTIGQLWTTQALYKDAARAYIHEQLLAAGVDYRSPFQEYGGITRDLIEGSLHMPLIVASELSLLPGAAPAPLALPLHSGAGHAVYWTRRAQRDLAVTVLGIYSEVVQALDDVRERIEANVAAMLDTSRGEADRQAAWAVVRALHTPADAAAKAANLRAAVARVRDRLEPPETDLAAYAGVRVDRLRAAGERRLRWLLGDPPRATSSQETAAADRIARAVREHALRIARAATALEAREAYALGAGLIEGTVIGAAPRWRRMRGAEGPPVDLPGAPVASAVVLPAAVRVGVAPLRAAVIEAWSPGEEPDDLSTAQPTLIESAVSNDPAKLRATVVRGASIGVDRLVLDWLTETPGAAVSVRAAARNVNGASERVFRVPAPIAAG